MHYVDEGTGDPIVLLHGNPTWGFLYRDFVTPLTAAGYRVIIPDMIGFGLSEKPAREQKHSLDGHIANLTALLRSLDLHHITLVCHDWGGPTGLGFALSNLARVQALVLMSTWAWPLPPAEFHTRIFPWRMMHAPLLGPYLLGRHNALAARGVYLSVVDRKRFQERAQAAYEAVLPDAASRLLTWTWPRWIPARRERARLRSLHLAGTDLSHCTLPALLIWGREDDVFDPNVFVPRFQTIAAACRRAAHGDWPPFPAGRLRSRNRRAHRRLPADGCHDHRLPPPPLDGKRLAFVLVEDRLGHYPEFRAFFVRTFDLDRVGLTQPGYVQAPSGNDLCADLPRP